MERKSNINVAVIGAGLTGLTTEIIQIVKEEISEMFQLPEFNPGLLKIFRYRHANPQYGFESEEKMKAISEIEAENPGLFLAGNIRDGIGISDRIHQGRMIAEQIANKV